LIGVVDTHAFWGSHGRTAYQEAHPIWGSRMTRSRAPTRCPGIIFGLKFSLHVVLWDFGHSGRRMGNTNRLRRRCWGRRCGPFSPAEPNAAPEGSA
jgi:hypothetical protein